jgi:pilus assembly protein Flp/PilA
VAVLSHRSSPNFTKSTLQKEDVLLKPTIHLRHAFMSFIHDESGQDLIEYALVAGLIGLGAVVAMSGLSNKIRQAFTSVGNGLTNAI